VNVLVDTSVWSLALRRRAQDLNAVEGSIVGELTELIKEGRTRIIGLVRQELLSGIKTSAQYDRLREILRSFPDEPIGTEDYETAARISNHCRSKGIAVSVPDMLICTIALSRGWSVFTNDPDFENYKNILQIKIHKPRK
jgi:predicted nucleic acid-binding protein